MTQKVGEADKVYEGSAVREFFLRTSAAGTVWRQNPRQRWSKVEKVRHVPRTQGRPTVGGAAGKRWTGGQDKVTKGSQSLGLYLIQQEYFGGLEEHGIL